MSQPTSPDDLIRRKFAEARKEYGAYDRTLGAIAALSFILENVQEIRAETRSVDFRPRLESLDVDTQPYTPDGLICQRPDHDFLLELKTQWNDKDAPQVVKYGRTSKYLDACGHSSAFSGNRCVLLGYQNVPGEEHLDGLMNAWDSAGLKFPLVVFRYSLEQGTESDRIYFVRVPYARNGSCPLTNLGKAFNSVRGYSVSVDSYKTHRARFHRTGDQVIDSYGAVLWWTLYAAHYLSDDQKSEMAERGRLSTPLIIPMDRIDHNPVPPGVATPLAPKDIRRALEFLARAGLVELKVRAKKFEVKLTEDRYIRLPRNGPELASKDSLDLSTKILIRWAHGVVKRPLPAAKRGSAPMRKKGARHRDTKSAWLPFATQ